MIESRTTHRALLVSMLVTIGFVAGACGGGGDSGGGGGGDASSSGGEQAVDIGPADVAIVNFAYEDPEFTATAGEEIVWVSEGAAPTPSPATTSIPA